MCSLTLKEAKKEAIASKRWCYLTISKQTEIGWYVEYQPTQRTVFWVYRDGALQLHRSDFARNYQRQHLPNVRLKK